MYLLAINSTQNRSPYLAADSSLSINNIAHPKLFFLKLLLSLFYSLNSNYKYKTTLLHQLSDVGLVKLVTPACKSSLKATSTHFGGEDIQIKAVLAEVGPRLRTDGPCSFSGQGFRPTAASIGHLLPKNQMYQLALSYFIVKFG